MLPDILDAKTYSGPTHISLILIDGLMQNIMGLDISVRIYLQLEFMQICASVFPLNDNDSLLTIIRMTFSGGIKACIGWRFA
jgi:hypothetical protein